MFFSFTPQPQEVVTVSHVDVRVHSLSTSIVVCQLVFRHSCRAEELVRRQHGCGRFRHLSFVVFIFVYCCVRSPFLSLYVISAHPLPLVTFRLHDCFLSALSVCLPFLDCGGASDRHVLGTSGRRASRGADPLRDIHMTSM